MSRYFFKQPDGACITMYIHVDTMSCYSDEDFVKNPNLKGHFQADLFIEIGGYNSLYHRTFEEHNKKFYFDDKGIYTYKKQKVPFYYWEPQNFEEDYENWTKTKDGYSIPLNEPRLLKKNIF